MGVHGTGRRGAKLLRAAAAVGFVTIMVLGLVGAPLWKWFSAARTHPLHYDRQMLLDDCAARRKSMLFQIEDTILEMPCKAVQYRRGAENGDGSLAFLESRFYYVEGGHLSADAPARLVHPQQSQLEVTFLPRKSQEPIDKTEAGLGTSIRPGVALYEHPPLRRGEYTELIVDVDDGASLSIECLGKPELVKATVGGEAAEGPLCSFEYSMSLHTYVAISVYESNAFLADLPMAAASTIQMLRKTLVHQKL